MARYFCLLESLGQIEEETMRVSKQAGGHQLVPFTNAAVLVQITKINKVLKAIMNRSSIPRDEEYHFRKRSVDLLEKWNEVIDPDGKNQAPTSTSPAVRKGKKGRGDAKSEDTMMKGVEENASEREERATNATDEVTTGEESRPPKKWAGRKRKAL